MKEEKKLSSMPIYAAEAAKRGEERKEARLLLLRLLSSFGISASYEDIKNRDDGSPYIDGREDIFISISHTKGAVAAAVAYSEIGIDIEPIEKLDEKKEKLTDRFFDGKKELKEDKSGKAFCLFWTECEARFKAGEGKSVFSSKKAAALPHSSQMITLNENEYAVTVANKDI